MFKTLGMIMWMLPSGELNGIQQEFNSMEECLASAPVVAFHLAPELIASGATAILWKCEPMGKDI